MMKSFLHNLALTATFGAGWAVAAVAVACLGLWLLGAADGGAPSSAGMQPAPRGATAMR